MVGWARLTKIEIETVGDRENLPDRRCRVEILGGEEPDFRRGEGGVCAGVKQFMPHSA